MSSPITCQNITDTQTPYKFLKNWVAQGGSIQATISGCGIQSATININFTGGNTITFTTPTITGQTSCTITITISYYNKPIFEASLSNLSASNMYILQVTYVLQ